MPSIQPSGGGTVGALHSKEFCAEDFEAAVLDPAKVMLMTLVDLLYDGAKRGQRGSREFQTGLYEGRISRCDGQQVLLLSNRKILYSF